MAHPFFAVTDARGRFSIANLPPGDYTLAAWHEVFGELGIKVGVKEKPTLAEFLFKPTEPE